MRKWPLAAVGFLFGISACSAPEVATRTPLYPLNETVSASPDSVTFLLPGALSSTAIFGPAREWGDPNNLVIEYRLPGMDGEPETSAVIIDQAATWVAKRAAQYPDANINLLGFSTGAAIAYEAAGQIDDGQRVKIAAVSSATPFPGAVLAAAKGGLQVVAAAIAANSFSIRTIWEEHYKTLLMGTGWRKDPARVALAEKLLSQLRSGITLPGNGLGRLHSGNLLQWQLSDQARNSGAQIMLYHGARDPVFPIAQARSLAENLNAELVVYNNGGHLLLQTHGEVISRIEAYFFK